MAVASGNTDLLALANLVDVLGVYADVEPHRREIRDDVGGLLLDLLPDAEMLGDDAPGDWGVEFITRYGGVGLGLDDVDLVLTETEQVPMRSVETSVRPPYSTPV